MMLVVVLRNRTVRYSISLLVILFILCTAASQARPEIFKEESLSAGQEEAKKLGKYLVVDFMATWCGPCKDMEKNSWTNRAVQDWINENAIAVQVDVDAQPKLSADVHVDAMPTIVVFSPTDPSVELARHAGHQNAIELRSWLDGIKIKRDLSRALSTTIDTLEEKCGGRQHLILDSAFLAAVVGLIFGAKPIGKKLNNTKQRMIEHNWVKVPSKDSPESKLIEGKWVGTYRYAVTDGIDTEKNADSTFAATFAGASAFSGHMIDSLGEATITGAVHYPKVRFRKSYARSAPGIKTASIFTVFFYEGRFVDEGQIDGEWFVSPWNKNGLRGTWSMKRTS